MNRLLGSFVLATFVIYIYIYLLEDKYYYLFLYWWRSMKDETYFPLQFIDLKIIWLAQRYTIITSKHSDLGNTCGKPLKA